ncbi:MAG TPA: polymer-forming cytoskeletal protein [Pyrinomonadaceae bacterium]|nr:polymer-forming cytoskeletal protein [Pyrinomonadaceae bacterium]
MTTLAESTELGGDTNDSLAATDPFGIGRSFDRWLQDLEAARNPFARETEAEKAEDSEIYIGSFPGSNCEIAFEGVLHFDGYSMGNMSSPEGTLVLTKRGRIEADVNVRAAVINGWVTGNITATESVVLESEARVTGQIQTRALSVRLGAVFDGECLLSAPENPREVAEPPQRKKSHWFEHLAAAAGA